MIVGMVAGLRLIEQSADAAGIVENFSYSNGSLTTVSGGVWQLWEPGAGNATITNGAFRYDGTTDVIRTFPAVLTAPGEVATFSFTINIPIANTSEGFAIEFEPTSVPFSSQTNYGSGFGIGFDYGVGAASMSTIEVSEGSGIPRGDNGGNNNVLIGAMLAGVTHTINVNLVRGATNTSYSLFLDNTLLRNGTFVMNDPRGINSVELDQSGASSPSATGYAVVDDLRVVPEPATGAMALLGAALLFTFRRR